MNILETLIQLRDDLKTWVTNNLNALNKKIDEKTIPIDSELSATSTNPVQNKVINAEIDSLNTLVGDTSVATQISTAIANQDLFSGDYNDLTNAPNITDDGSDDLNITDNDGNIIVRVNSTGIHTTEIEVNDVKVGETLSSHINNNDIHVTADDKNTWNAKSDFSGDYNDLINAPNILEDDSERVVIADEKGNIVFQVDKDGINSTNLNLQGQSVLSLIENKVEKEEGKGLSSNDYTDIDKAKLALISSDMVEASMDSELSLTSDNPVKNKVITKALQNISYHDLKDKPNINDNDSDDLVITDDAGNIIVKIDSQGINAADVLIKGESVGSITESKVKEQCDEIREEVEELSTIIEGLNEDIESKASQEEVTTHITTNSIHTSQDEKKRWNNKSDFSGDYLDLTNKPNITENETNDVLISDDDGNVIVKIDDKGIHTTDVLIGENSLLTQVDSKLQDIDAIMESYKGEINSRIDSFEELISLTKVTYSTTDLVAGASKLETGSLYIVYE